jgi:hypothetical protein
MVSIMDIYVLGRILRTYEKNNLGAKNIIIITGYAHTDAYINFFTKIGGEQIFNHINIDNRCVKFEEIKFD